MGTLSKEDKETILAFAGNAMNTTKAAKMIYLHRNTVVWRLDRIQKKTGLNPRNFYDLVRLVEGRTIMRREITPGIYRHFKGNLYQVLHIATHSETREKVVVYQALYGEYGIYVRPYDMFASEVDREKYPDAKQTYRFERADQSEDTPL